MKKEIKIPELHNAIHEVYKNESACASAMGWTRQKLNKITNMIKEPTVGELNELAVALKKTVGEVASFFLNNESPNEQQKGVN